MTPPYPKPGKHVKPRPTLYAIREQLFTRDGYQCVCAPFAGHDDVEACHGPLTIQHRIGKGMGGSGLFDEPGNLLTMCFWHNTLAERDADFAALCTTNGWSIPRRNQVDVHPERVPVLYGDGWHLLDLLTCASSLISFEAALRLKAEA